MSTLNLDTVVTLVCAAGVPARVLQTGGGVATVYAGRSRIDADGCDHYTVAAGPGTYGGLRTASTADLDGFCVGPDTDDEDAPVRYLTAAEVTGSPEEYAAAVIVETTRQVAA